MSLSSAPNGAPASNVTDSAIPMIELNDVSFGYTKDRKILSGVTLTVPKGKLVAVMGGSGCGKTTILRLLCGQHSASAGEVKVAGKSIDAMTRDELPPLRDVVSIWRAVYRLNGV
jgi:phospholipid/cholesterol/gamma-HCH transport system ATP-binding protein